MLPLALRQAAAGRPRSGGAGQARAGGPRRPAAASRPQQLSGGQQQRVAIARALVNNPQAPAGGRADRRARQQDVGDIMQLFDDLNEHGITIVLVTHETDVARHARRRIVLRDGRMVEDVPQVARRPGSRFCRACVHRHSHDACSISSRPHCSAIATNTLQERADDARHHHRRRLGDRHGRRRRRRTLRGRPADQQPRHQRARRQPERARLRRPLQRPRTPTGPFPRTISPPSKTKVAGRGRHLGPALGQHHRGAGQRQHVDAHLGRARAIPGRCGTGSLLPAGAHGGGYRGRKAGGPAGPVGRQEAVRRQRFRSGR